MGKLDNRIAAITGSSSGIGAATARLFAAEGAQVILADIDEAGGRRVTGEIGGSAVFLKTDVRMPTQVEGLVKFAVERFGRLDILHNNAFATCFGPVGDIPVEGWLATISVTLSGVFYGLRFSPASDGQARRGRDRQHGLDFWLFGDYGLGAYNAAKLEL